MGEWFENESFWETLFPIMFPAARFERAVEQVENLLTLVDFQGRSVLDLCCGPGRHSVALARLGYAVTGVDRTPYLLDRARDYAASEGVEVEWVREDMRRFKRDGSFDLALNLFTSFGYFETEDEDRSVLTNVHRSLRPNGMLVIDIVGKEWLAKVFEATTSTRETDGSLLIQRHDVTDDWTRIRNEWILLRGDMAHTFHFDHTIYSARELMGLLRQSGFISIRSYGGFDGRPYDREADRLIVIGQKPCD